VDPERNGTDSDVEDDGPTEVGMAFRFGTAPLDREGHGAREWPMAVKIDDIDRRIILLLQQDGACRRGTSAAASAASATAPFATASTA
jgi:hypothetical protein